MSKVRRMTHVEILNLILSRSERAAHEVQGALRAIEHESPMAQSRCGRAATIALDDDQADFTREERELIVTLFSTTPLLSHVRGFYLNIAVSQGDLNRLQAEAEQAGLSFDDHIRQRLGLPLPDKRVGLSTQDYSLDEMFGQPRSEQ